MIRHLKYSFPDFILCTLMSMSLGFNVVQSFYLPEGLSADVLRLLAVSAVVIAVLVLLSYSRRSVILTCVMAVCLLIIIVGGTAMGLVPTLRESADPEANGPLWYVVAVCCALVVYLLSRTRAGSWFLLGFGALTLAYFVLLEYTFYLWCALLFLWCAGVWLCYLTYRKRMLAVSASVTAFLPTLAWSAVTATVALALGCLLWWGIIRPLQPPTKELILLDKPYTTELLERTGVAKPSYNYDQNQAAEEINEEAEPPVNEYEAADEGAPEQAEETPQEEHQEEVKEPDSDTDQTDQPEGESHHIRYTGWSTLEKIILGALLALLVIALIILFLKRRSIWYRHKTRDLDDEGYIRFFYPWYLRKLRVLSLPKPAGNTPLEYARQEETATRFLERTGVTWMELTEIYTRVVYGGRGTQPGDKEKFEQLYKGFYKCCRKKLRFGYVLRCLRL